MRKNKKENKEQSSSHIDEDEGTSYQWTAYD